MQSQAFLQSNVRCWQPELNFFLGVQARVVEHSRLGPLHYLAFGEFQDFRFFLDGGLDKDNYATKIMAARNLLNTLA